MHSDFRPQVKSVLAFAAKLARHLEEHPSVDATDLWFTLSEGRRRFPARAVVLAASRTEAVAALRALTEGDIATPAVRLPGRNSGAPWLSRRPG